MAGQQGNATVYPSATTVGNAFVTQYYSVMRAHPDHVFRFYQDTSKLGRPEPNGKMSCTTTMQAINEKIMSLDYGEFKAEIKTVDSQDSFQQGVIVLVTGTLYGENNSRRNFTQTFFLAPQERGYFVLNDVFRYLDEPSQLVNNGTSERSLEAPASEAAEHVTVEQEEYHSGAHDIELEEETIVEDDYSISESVDVPTAEEESAPELNAEVVQDEQPSPVDVPPVNQDDDAPKESYASIVKNKEKKAQPVSQQSSPQASTVSKAAATPVAEAVVPAAAELPFENDTLVPAPSFPENSNATEPDNGDGRSIYVKNLPLNATASQLEEEFRKFGSIKKPDGVQVRCNKMQGFCYGFVEFDSSISVQVAIEASPITIGGRQAQVEEKRPSSSRVGRPRFPPRGTYRNDGGRGRGSYGNRGYGRGDYINRSEFSNRGRGGAGRGASSGNMEGYQRVDHFGNGTRGSRTGLLSRNSLRGGS